VENVEGSIVAKLDIVPIIFLEVLSKIKKPSITLTGIAIEI
jgi:hypothetical protein